MLLMLLLRSPYRFKGEADPLLHIQPCALMLLYFQPCSLSESSLLFILNVNPPPLTQILAFPLQLYVPPLQPLSTCAHPTPLPVLLQGRCKPLILSSTVCAYVPLLFALLLRKGVPLRKPSAKPSPFPQLSAFPLQQSVTTLHPLAVRDPPPPPLSVSLQGLGVHPLLPSAVRDYSPLLW